MNILEFDLLLLSRVDYSLIIHQIFSPRLPPYLQCRSLHLWLIDFGLGHMTFFGQWVVRGDDALWDLSYGACLCSPSWSAYFPPGEEYVC